MSNDVKKHDLLNAEQMASFVTNGYLMVENLVPHKLNQLVCEELQKNQFEGKDGYKYWFESSVIQDVFALPQVEAVIQSLVGVNPSYDHSFLHSVAPHHHKAQHWHGDSIIDTRRYGFDIQIFYFPHDTPKEMGPTLILPGSHLRRINTASISRYKNIKGQIQLATHAGTMVFWHQGLWHCAQPNYTDHMRYVFKLRLRPGQIQRGLFNTEGYDGSHVRKILSHHFPWQGNEARLEQVQRAKLWRYVTGDDQIDTSFEGALTRMSISL
jgi:hypothetical protein